MLFAVAGAAAHLAGIRFYKASNVVWIVDAVPVRFLSILEGADLVPLDACGPMLVGWSNRRIETRRLPVAGDA